MSDLSRRLLVRASGGPVGEPLARHSRADRARVANVRDKAERQLRRCRPRDDHEGNIVELDWWRR
jgi:hypothetical protein